MSVDLSIVQAVISVFIKRRKNFRLQLSRDLIKQLYTLIKQSAATELQLETIHKQILIWCV